MKTIFITISRGSLIRNFFHTGVVSRILDKGVKVVALLPEDVDKESLKDYTSKNLIIEPLLSPRGMRFKRFILECFKGAVFNKTVHIRYRYRFAGENPSKLLYLPRMMFMAPLRFIPGFKKFIRWVEFKINSQPEHDYLFEKYKPDLVFATTAQTSSDVGVLKSAKRFGVPAVQMAKSWDNLSKMLFDVKTDYMIVWNEFMKKQALFLQDYKDSEIIVTGAPQFDYYAQKENLWSREHFCEIFSLDPDKKIILYGSTGGHCAYEADYIQLIKNYIDKGFLTNVQIFIRPHVGYVGDEDKFLKVEKCDDVFVDRSARRNENFKDKWDISRDHLKVLFNSLYYADVCINMASTLTIDATLCDTSVINISFDTDGPVPYSMSPRRFYKTDYISEVTGFGITWLVESEEDFKNALIDILEKGEKKDERKEDFIKYFAYKKDGKAAERIAYSLINIMNKDE